ncbi:hypothetical protein HBI47_236950 [Parastagonospora nodorum]|nr:hypothetical protein HBI47_236950 [Parastagonospora nodorum]
MLGGHAAPHDSQCPEQGLACRRMFGSMSAVRTTRLDYPRSGVAAVACSRVVVEAEVAEQHSRHSGNGDDERDADWRGELEAITESKLALG